MNLPPLKPTPTTTTTNAATTSNNQCSNCGFSKRSLFHHVHLRGIDRRLCTSCVLRLHPSSFCPSCFEFFDHPLSTTSSASAHRFISCIKCSSLTHLQCLPSPPPPTSSFLCPPCSTPNFSFFDLDGSDSSRVLDKRLTLVLLCAAKIASASMTKALDSARVKADRSVREAAVARKRAKEALEHLSAVDKARRVDASLEFSGSRNLETKDSDNVQKVLNPGPGLKVMHKNNDSDGFVGPNKVLPQNGLSVVVQGADKKNEAPDSVVGRDPSFRGNGIAFVNDKSANDDKLGNHEGDLERVQSSNGRIVDVSFT